MSTSLYLEKKKKNNKTLNNMDNKIEGKILSKFPAESGTSARGEWKKQKFLVETMDQYPRKVCIDVWTNVIPQLEAFKEGDQVAVSINIESREFNGKWYTDVRAWRIDHFQPGAVPPPQNYQPQAQPQMQPQPQSQYAAPQAQYPPQQPAEQAPFVDAGADDLPF